MIGTNYVKIINIKVVYLRETISNDSKGFISFSKESIK